MEQGKVEDFIVRQTARDKKPVPKRMQDKPKLLPGLDLFYMAFLDLYCDRCDPGMPIMFSSKLAWAKAAGITAWEDFQRFKALVGALDTVYLNHLAHKPPPVPESPKPVAPAKAASVSVARKR